MQTRVCFDVSAEVCSLRGRGPFDSMSGVRMALGHKDGKEGNSPDKSSRHLEEPT